MISIETVEQFHKALKKERTLTIVCAESITAGLLASTIASVSGASAILKGSIVTYDENVKVKILGVRRKILKKYTAESQQTTTAMCYGIKRLYPNADIHVAVTGMASAIDPSTDYKATASVGQIYVAIFYKKLHPFKHSFLPEDIIDKNNSRNEIRDKTVEYIFEQIEKLIA
ncbi:CinA family protein [Mucilaginibacter pedocola]|uniref:CinA C-terminal domain-containing protein n=1 Tax=Mucilaginibacter pedocola TaxID=1792845 RepID=A0A1S9P9N8_9SPHI|nr:nicotinamide-nucleotide amidohydrolase family protein [Mucilaginibacter pedocola]OOQ57694.1 hypothetical protein BC343_12920 [Mucilaginibacter pedocola]